MSGYVEPRRARHRIEYVEGVEQIRLPVRKQIFLLLFLPVWLTGWTAGGVAAIYEFVRTGEPFLAFWLCGWGVGWLFAAGTVASQLIGAETLRVTGGDLEVQHSIGPLRRTWRYHGSAIRHLSRFHPDNGLFARRGMEFPLFFRARSGEVRFDYGADRINIAAGAAGSDGDAILDWLKGRLPQSASEA